MDGEMVLENRSATEALRQSEVFARAMRSIEAKKRESEKMGYALMAGASAFEPTAKGEGMLGKAAHYSKLFCIAFAMLAPNYLIWRLLL
ncbi:MAG: hypothetical protein ACLFQL_04745 [Paracoccaceae bacterium]